MFTATKATYKVADMRRRIRAICGGTSAGKTIAVLQVLIQMSQTDKTPKLTSVVSESLPHLKLGAMRDFLQIMKEHNYYKEDAWNRTDFIYTFETGSKIEFFGADSPAKAHGPRRHRLFINEANNVPFSSFEQMEVRTSDIIFLDWNPSNEFWWYTDVKDQRESSVDFITLTYLDNESLAPAIVQSIESRRNNKNWWQVYGLGLLGNADGNVYTNWSIIDEVPHEARLERRGLDFGYSNDPAALVDIHYYNGGYVLDERLYQKGLLNRPLADFITNLEEPQTTVIADSAEPKSIDELKMYGVNVLPCLKGADSIRSGIKYVQGQRISMTRRSVNLIKEYRNYMWETDRDGRQTGDAGKFNNHLLDALRYGMEGLREPASEPIIVGWQEGLGGAQIPIYSI